MTSAAPHYHQTFNDYLEIEEMSEAKHEYVDGQVVAMSGGSIDHAALCGEIGARLRELCAGKPCRAYPSDLRIRVLATGLATYADASVVCGRPETDPESPTHCTNPSVIFEVLSPSSERYDRGKKRKHYQQIESLHDYVIVSQDSRAAEQWTRDDRGGWTHRVIGPEGEIVLETLGGLIVLADLYSSVGL